MSKGMFEKKGQHVYKTVGGKSLVLLLALVLVVGGMIGGTVAWLTANTEKVTNVFTTSDIKIELKEHKYSPTEDKLTNEETTDGVDNYQMVPGWKIPKDPWVTVSADSEDCYLFIKVEESENYDTYMTYAIQTDENIYANPWKVLDATKYPGVYYKEIDADNERVSNSAELVKHYILAGGSYTDPMGTQDDSSDDVKIEWVDNQVATKPSVTKEMMNDVKGKEPTLTFTAYAVQMWKSNKPADDAAVDVIAAAKFTPEEAWLKRPLSLGN